MAWQCYQKLRAVYHARPDQGRRLVAEVLAAFPTCPIPEVARLGRTLRRWKAAILAYFDTAGASNGPVEAVNGGRVHVNGARVKPSKDVRPGDELEITVGSVRRTVLIRCTAPRRSPASGSAAQFASNAGSRRSLPEVATI